MPRLIADRAVLRTTSALTEVMAAARAREQRGERVLHLERGEPDFETPPHIVEALAEAARAGETHYPDPRGTPRLREALVAKLARENGIVCDPADVVVTQGGTHGLYLAFQGLLGPGDELLALAPHWMAIPKLVGFAYGATMREFPAYLELAAGTESPAQLGARLRAALRPETRGIYLNSPNNPTGVVLTRDQLQAIAEVAIARDLWVVSDEAYEHLLFDDARHVSLATLPGMFERTISVFTFSKSYAMTGWRIGYVVAPPAMRPTLGPLLTYYTTHGVFPAAQTAARVAIESSQECVGVMTRAYQERRDLLLEALAAQPALQVPRPRGAFYVFADVAGALQGDDVWALVREWLELGVAVLPGTAFGAEYDHHVRLSLATRREDVLDAGQRLAAHDMARGPASARAARGSR